MASTNQEGQAIMHFEMDGQGLSGQVRQFRQVGPVRSQEILSTPDSTRDVFPNCVTSDEGY